jgi:hypothetical protein
MRKRCCSAEGKRAPRACLYTVCTHQHGRMMLRGAQLDDRCACMAESQVCMTKRPRGLLSCFCRLRLESEARMSGAIQSSTGAWRSWFVSGCSRKMALELYSSGLIVRTSGYIFASCPCYSLKACSQTCCKPANSSITTFLLEVRRLLEPVNTATPSLAYASLV